MDAEKICTVRVVADRLIATGLGLSGLSEIMQLLSEGRHRDVRGDVFYFLEISLRTYSGTVLEEAGNLKNMIGEM